MTALRREVFNLLKREILYLLYVLLIVLLVFKIAFFNESIVVLIRSILSLFWVFIIPGYFAMIFWHDKLDFIQRILIGTAASAGLTGTISYYLGLAGLNIKYHTVLLPLLIIILGSSFLMMKANKEKTSENN